MGILENKVNDCCKWYQDCRPLYISLSSKVESIIRDVFKAENISYYSVTSRAKDIDSFKEKASKEKYKDPKTDIMDLAGIRVIAYFDSDVQKICELIKQLFNIIPEHSVDKTELLGIDKVGYRSVHYVAELPDTRTNLMECKMFKNMRFEIQVRTILQHTWAEIEHDRRYKFKGVLPIHLRRRFSLVAGLLEMSDHEFESISSEIDRYATSVSRDTSNGDLDILIDTTSLREYMIHKFSSSISEGFNASFGPDDESLDIIQELNDFGIKTLKELDLIIPNDLKEKVPHELSADNNFAGLLRTIMIINNHNKYFSKAWKQHWGGLDRNTYDTMISYNIPLGDYSEILGLEHDFEDERD